MRKNTNLYLSYIFMIGMCLPATVWAGSDTEKLEWLEMQMLQQQELLQLQQQQLEEQAKLIAKQQIELQGIRARLILKTKMSELRAAGPLVPAGPLDHIAQPTNSGRIQVSQADTQSPDQPVGQPPPEKETKQRPEIQAISNIGGVLTPKGTWVIEPSFQFSNSQVNRLSFLGVEILETFLIGIIEAEDADRNLFSTALTVRYGLTPRLEIEAKIPYIWRDDVLRATIPATVGSPRVTRDLDGEGIGDAEVAMHYQLNAGNNGWPIFIGNLRYKSTTGAGPYDVLRNSAGIQTELPTGSGFHGIEPSITALYRSDPAVFYANLGYLHNIEKDVNKTFVIEGSDDQIIGNVDPGDVQRFSFGMAYSINSTSSFSLGYKHDFIEKTNSIINNVNFSTVSLDIGSLLLGFSHQITPNTSINLNLELGVTADAPDTGITLRLPHTF